MPLCHSLTVILAFVLSSSLLLPTAAQQSPTLSTQSVQRDPQALTILSQALSAAGGVASIAGLRDVTATGTITYFWADQQVPGSVTLKGRGLAQFRLDAILAAGPRSFVVNN